MNPSGLQKLPHSNPPTLTNHTTVVTDISLLGPPALCRCGCHMEPLQSGHIATTTACFSRKDVVAWKLQVDVGREITLEVVYFRLKQLSLGKAWMKTYVGSPQNIQLVDEVSLNEVTSRRNHVVRSEGGMVVVEVAVEREVVLQGGWYFMSEDGYDDDDREEEEEEDHEYNDEGEDELMFVASYHLDGEKTQFGGFSYDYISNII